ncbi:hypothetical protein HX099_06480 [Thiopseudomonas alkaliphila]|uniref:Uncharacterized protein n=1 Tax=Thiopseudomonas alkaliphila TaxID=1697053 RepID=A0AAW7DQC6_9GAMM|nr:hypothetical protein [Thiopseudomonas alkaliphila]MDM1696307.1 hypothetical protein [Thiopseudomonas alkaliphila]
MKKTTIALLGFSERAQSILGLYLSRRKMAKYTLVEGVGTLNIIDFDCVNAEQLWEKHKTGAGEIPTIVVSMQELQLENALWFKKPLNLELLTETIDRLVAEYQLSQLAKQDNATAGLDPEETAENTQPKADLSEQRLFISQSLQGYSQSYRKNQVKHSSDAYEEKRSLQWFYGMRDDEDYLDSSKSDELYYQPANYLQGVFMQAQQLAKSQGQPVLINGGGVNMVITDLGTRVYSETKDTLLHKVSFINTEEQSLFIAKAVEQHSFLEQRLSRLTRRASSELLWSLSMWSSKGRLPLNISGESIIQLKRWPNFTRKDLSPHAMEIAALWFNQKVSINETAAILAVPYRAVYSVFSACYALDLIEFIDEVEPKNQLSSSKQKVSLPKRIFRALFNKLS